MLVFLFDFFIHYVIKYKQILEKSDDINDDLFDKLEEIFIMSVIGVDTVLDFIDSLKDEVKIRGIKNPLDLQEIIMDKMFEIYLNGEVVNANLKMNKNGLIVNGGASDINDSEYQEFISALNI